ncbi:hypothetical protein BC827DRAFT_1201554 [Russula dissimulans]|nr:hypothetical protein BC827DRAFT_1201554 [Russula dissimulans]
MQDLIAFAWRSNDVISMFQIGRACDLAARPLHQISRRSPRIWRTHAASVLSCGTEKELTYTEASR